MFHDFIMQLTCILYVHTTRAWYYMHATSCVAVAMRRRRAVPRRVDAAAALPSTVALPPSSPQAKLQVNQGNT